MFHLKFQLKFCKKLREKIKKISKIQISSKSLWKKFLGLIFLKFVEAGEKNW